MKSRFPLVEIRKLVDKASTPVDVDLDAEYVQIGIRSHGKGLFDKGAVSGKALGDKRVFWVEPDCFVVNIVFAWEQAVGKTSNADVGKIASHRFPMYRPKPGKADVDYLVYLFKTRLGKHLLTLASPGGAGRNKTLGQTEFSRIEIPCPPFAEQKRIAEILSTWDRAIETTEKLIAKSEAQKKALMQQLLTGKKRLPGFRAEWRTRKLSEFCTVRRGASPRPIDSPKWFSESGRAWVRISDVTKSNDETLEHADQYLSAEGAANSVAVDPGDLIMSICATIGVPKFLGIPACIHDGFVVFREVSPRLALPFLFYVLEAATERLANSGQPGTQKNLNTSIVGEILVPDIEVAEQLAIAERLKRADNILRRISDKLKILRAEKSALMQQLLTGKRRVKINGEAQAA